MVREDSRDRRGAVVRERALGFVIVLVLVLVIAGEETFRARVRARARSRFGRAAFGWRARAEAETLRACMKKVLILSASYGEGHNAAGRGLLAALAQHPEAEATMY